MATSRNDPRVIAAVNGAMKAAYSKKGVTDRRGDFVWSVVYPAWAYKNGYAWCGAFWVWAYRQVGVDLMKCAWWFYTPYIVNFAKQKGFWRTQSGYGWMVLFSWARNGVAAHVSGSNPDAKASLFRSLGGNTSSGTAGSQSNGGGVWERYRHRADIMGWVDMHAVLAWMIDTGRWDGKISTAGVTSSKPHVTQTLTKTDRQYMLDVDGSRGPATNARWQQVMGTPIDGRIDSPSLCVRATQRFLNGAVSAQSIRDLTGKSKLDTDGLLGPRTVRVLQFVLFNWYAKAVLGRTINVALDCDGSFGSTTTKLFQHALNRSYANSGKIGAK